MAFGAEKVNTFRFGERRDDPAKSIYWRLKELGDFPVLYGIYGAVSSFVSVSIPSDWFVTCIRIIFPAKRRNVSRNLFPYLY